MTQAALPKWRLADEQMYVMNWEGDEWAVQLVSERWLVWHFQPGMPLEPDVLSKVWQHSWGGMPCVSHHRTRSDAQGAVMSQIYSRLYDNVVEFRPRKVA